MESVMVAYDGTIRNSVNQVIQLRYGEDGMDATYIEFQNMPSLKPTNVAFDRKFHFEAGIERYKNLYVFYMDGAYYSFFKYSSRLFFFQIWCFFWHLIFRRLKRFLQDEIVREIVSGAAAQQELEAEFSQLEKDRETLRAIFPTGNSKVGYVVFIFVLRCYLILYYFYFII